MKKTVFIITMTFVLLLALINILVYDNDASAELIYCCNNNFPPPPPDGQPNYTAQMHCDGDPYTITYEICARYWSAYLKYGDRNPVELCNYLPGNPPLPDVPIPSNFYVTVNNNNHPVMHWTSYYVHSYEIYRKKDSGSWLKIKTITSAGQNSYVDVKISLPDGHSYYYKMRGKVYNTYSTFTDVEVPSINKYSIPKNRPEKDNIYASVATSFKLIDNYPNPFNPETRIRYFLSSPGLVLLNIFNQQGQLIRTLVNELQPAGNYIVVWNGKDEHGSELSSGVYICRLQISGYSQNLKMIKLK